MTEPLNYEGPLAADVVQRVSDFLLKPVKNDTGGWTEVSREDWFELVDIFRDIIDAKFERDPDGDHTIEFETCHRQQGRMQTVHIPYNFDTPKDLEKAAHAISVASGIVEQVSRSLQFKYAEQRRADARKEKMAPVIEFLHATGYDDACHRVEQYVAGNGDLFVGPRDEVWAPLGLTCAEIEQTQRDNYGPRYHDAVDDLLLTAMKAMGGPNDD